jgi:hypothetical protein
MLAPVPPAAIARTALPPAIGPRAGLLRPRPVDAAFFA